MSTFMIPSVPLKIYGIAQPNAEAGANAGIFQLLNDRRVLRESAAHAAIIG